MSLILVGEANPHSSEAIRHALQDEGHIVGIVSNGSDIVPIAALKAPALIILNTRLMIGASGSAALLALRTNPKTADIPVMMIVSSRSDGEIARRAGANDYLVAPIDIDQLVVRSALLIREQPEDHHPAPAVHRRAVSTDAIAQGRRRASLVAS